ncbi:MAG: hypothetical protein J7L15_04885 [Clostridiales bacterium]|nr:hypothetical protein [Clostridiales bacterium]
MTESDYITKYVTYLKAKKCERDNHRETLAKLEFNFIDVETDAIESGIDVKHVHAAVNAIKKEQQKNKIIQEQEQKNMRLILKEFEENNA